MMRLALPFLCLSLFAGLAIGRFGFGGGHEWDHESDEDGSGEDRNCRQWFVESSVNGNCTAEAGNKTLLTGSFAQHLDAFNVRESSRSGAVVR